MEFDSVVGLAFEYVVVLEEHAQSLKNGDSARAVIVCTRSGEQGGKEQVNAVLVGAYDDGLITLSGNGGNDAVLAPWMLEMSDVSAVVKSTRLGKSVVDLS